MASLSGINKIVKLQRLLLPMNPHNSSLLACSTYTSTVLLQHQRIRLVRTRASLLPSILLETTPNHAFKRPALGVRLSSSSSSKATSNDTIDEFRAREEKREQEFEEKTRQQTPGVDEEEIKRQKVDAIRAQILDAALAHVQTHGWTRKAITQGAEDVGFPSVVHGMFPEGGFALVSHFYGKCNDTLIRHLQAETLNGQKEVSNPLDFIVNAVRMRLEMIAPYKSQWPQAMALIALPQNASTALAQVLTLVDDICYYSGDRSVDFGWYTRRVGLATIMKMTELYMLQDSSTNHSNTWEFLKNRMDEAMQLQMILSQGEGMTHSFQRSFNSAFITARNILGLDYNRR